MSVGPTTSYKNTFYSYHSQPFMEVYIFLIMTRAVWNGASFYVEVFSRKYVEGINKKKAEFEQWQSQHEKKAEEEKKLRKMLAACNSASGVTSAVMCSSADIGSASISSNFPREDRASFAEDHQNSPEKNPRPENNAD